MLRRNVWQWHRSTWEGDWILLAGRLGQAVEGKKVEVLANSNSASTHLHLGDLS
jgi:hypothetical protein